jgi:DNA-binding response OmpR family regulator
VIGATTAIVQLASCAVDAAEISVLVVDDDSGLRTLSRIVLQLEGFDVREASSLAEADAALAERRPDVVLLDVHLGLEQSEPLFERLRGEGIPVAAVTGTADLADVRTWADATLAKPFDPAELVALARRLARVDGG